MLTKIISPGQSAVGRAARAAAAKAGIAYGLAIPAAPMTIGQSLASDSKPDARADAGASNRVDKAVSVADGTLLVTIGGLDCNLERLRDLAASQRRPWMHADFGMLPAFKAAKAISDWLIQNRIETLLVIGSEDNANPEIYEKTYHVLTSAYWLWQNGQRGPASSGGASPNPQGKSRPLNRPPVSVAEAVSRLIAEMPLKDRATVSNMTERELYTLNFTLGAYIRNHFGIWTGNQALMISCREVSENPNLPQKDASSVIIKELWKTLKKTHKLRVIKP